MKLHPRRGFQRIILAGLVFLLVQLACVEGVASTDPRIPESFINVVGQFDPFLSGLQVIPIGGLQPPLITQLLPDSVSGLGSIESVGSGVVDSTGTVPTESSFKIRLYRMQPQGCGKEPIRGELLAETTVDFGGTWVINGRFEPGEVVAATQVSEGDESGLSNLRVNLEGDLLAVDKENEIQQVEHDVSQKFVLTGSSFPGACIILLNQNMEIGRVGSVSVSTSGEQRGKWNILVPLQEGENKYRIYIEGWEEIKKDYIIRGFFSHMQWPVGKKDGDNYIPNFDSDINAFFGRNDYYYYTPILYRFHDGIDLSGEIGTPILAVAKGDVFYIHVASGIPGNMDGGNIIFIDHGGWFSFYMHLDKITVNGLDTPKKDTYYDPSVKKIEVQAGEKIGEMGNTGLWECTQNCGDNDKSNNVYKPCCKHLHFSAFLWNKGNRTATLEGKTLPPFGWYQYGKKINVNPPKDATLNKNINMLDRVKGCASDINYWDVDWTSISVTEYKGNSGTEFNNLAEGQECTIP